MSHENFITVKDKTIKRNFKKFFSVLVAYNIGGSKGGGVGTRPVGVQILLFICSFWQKYQVSTTTLGVGAPSGKSWIRHCTKFNDNYIIVVINNCIKFNEIF